MNSFFDEESNQQGLKSSCLTTITEREEPHAFRQFSEFPSVFPDPLLEVLSFSDVVCAVGKLEDVNDGTGLNRRRGRRGRFNLDYLVVILDRGVYFIDWTTRLSIVIDQRGGLMNILASEIECMFDDFKGESVFTSGCNALGVAAFSRYQLEAVHLDPFHGKMMTEGKKFVKMGSPNTRDITFLGKPFNDSCRQSRRIRSARASAELIYKQQNGSICIGMAERNCHSLGFCCEGRQAFGRSVAER